MIVAPRSASRAVAYGPASARVRSRTTMPSSGSGAGAGTGTGTRSALQPDVDLLGLREAGQHPLERDLAADAALLVAAVGLPDDLSAALVDLHPAGLDAVRGGDGGIQVVGPDVGGEPVVRVVRHAHDVVDVGPRDRDQHRSEDLLLSQPEVVAHPAEDGGHVVVALGQRAARGHL